MEKLEGFPVSAITWVDHMYDGMSFGDCSRESAGASKNARRDLFTADGALNISDVKFLRQCILDKGSILGVFCELGSFERRLETVPGALQAAGTPNSESLSEQTQGNV
jgi:hypothetical protein